MSTSNFGLIPNMTSSSRIRVSSGVIEVTSQDVVASPDSEDGAFISKLPNELLFKVFLANSEKYLTLEKDLVRELDNSPRAAFKSITDNSQHARAASQVCRRWREVTLAASALWGRVLDTHTMPPLWFEEVLRRSGSAPLIVVSVSTRGPSNDPYSQANIRLLLQPDVLNRLEVFHVNSQDPAIINAAKGNSFRLLKRCSLKFPLRSNLDISRRCFGSVQLFNDQAPFLQQLQISGIIPRASYTFYSTLTSLHIYHASLSSILILRILQQTPMLQELSLGENVTDPDQLLQSQDSELNNLDISSIPVVRLSHLKRLRVYQMFTASLLEIVSRLRPKAIKSLYIGAVKAFPGELCDTLMASISKHLSPYRPSTASNPDLRLASMAFYPLNLEIGPKNIIVVQRFHTALMHKVPGIKIPDPELSLNLAIRLRDLTGTLFDLKDVAKMLRQLWARLAPSFSNCHFLIILFREGDYAFDEQDWKSMLACFGSLLALDLNRVRFVEDILRTLSLPPVYDAPMAPASDSELTPELDEKVNTKSKLAKPLLRSLQALAFPQEAINDNSAFVALTKFLTFRRNQNSQIRKLALFPDESLPAMPRQGTEENPADYRCASANPDVSMQALRSTP